MKKVFLLLSVLVGILVLSSCGQPQPPPPPPPQEAGKFRVEVSRFGFNKTPGEFRLEVEAGQEVEITFVYGDGDLPYNNRHAFFLDFDLDVAPFILDRENPEVTVSFTTRAGEVVFRCANAMCTGHANLQGGIIVIKPGS